MKIEMKACAFSIILLAFLLPASSMCAQERDAAGDREAMAQWTKRAEEHRAAIEDLDELAAVDVALGVIYAKSGNAEQALAAVRRLLASDSKVASGELWQVGMMIAQHLEAEAGKQVLRAYEDPVQRDKDAVYMFGGFGARGDLQAARDAEELITDDDARFQAKLFFFAGAMDMDVARKALAELNPATEEQRRKAESIATMLDRRAENLAKEPPSAEELTEKAKESSYAYDWRAAAEAWRKEDQPNKAREALDKAVAVVDEIEYVSFRAGALTLIANEYVELQDSLAASRAIKRAVAVLEAEQKAKVRDEAGPAEQLADVLDAVIFGPSLITTLARCGELDLALQCAAPARQFAVVGAGCTSAKMQAELERSLTDLDSPCDRALACAGVAQGLLELQAQCAEPKPDESRNGK